MEGTLTKQEAIRALKDGKNVTHQLMDDTEWFKKAPDNMIVFEDGVYQDEVEFWMMRQGSQWEDGYSIV